MAEILEVEKKIITLTTMVIAGVASISLLVGGIGIMNIMLVSVKERTREIGLRKAVGATKRNILSQFIFEGIMLCALGGIFGIILGLIIIIIIAPLIQIPIKISWLAISVGIIFSTLVGLFFTFYPARQAANLSPVEALRYE